MIAEDNIQQVGVLAILISIDGANVVTTRLIKVQQSGRIRDFYDMLSKALG